jgi:glucan phosphoethanolaminetransferase (alkaline phosphatase superfamily)
MIAWIIIAGVIIIALIWLEVEKKFKWVKIVLLLALVAILYFSFLGASKTQEFDYSSPRGIYMAVYSYVNWVGSTAKDVFAIGKDTVLLVGDVIKENHSSENV